MPGWKKVCCAASTLATWSIGDRKLWTQGLVVANDTQADDEVYCPSCEEVIAMSVVDGRDIARCRCGQTKKWLYREEMDSVNGISVTEVVFEDLDDDSWSR
jgi:hypothetical protein